MSIYFPWLTLMLFHHDSSASDWQHDLVVAVVVVLLLKLRADNSRSVGEAGLGRRFQLQTTPWGRLVASSLIRWL